MDLRASAHLRIHVQSFSCERHTSPVLMMPVEPQPYAARNFTSFQQAVAIPAHMTGCFSDPPSVVC